MSKHRELVDEFQDVTDTILKDLELDSSSSDEDIYHNHIHDNDIVIIQNH